MGDYELTQGKQKEFAEVQMTEMIKDAQLYGQAMSDQDRDIYMASAGNESVAHQESFKALQKQISEMMLVDVENAEKLKEDYPEAYKEMQDEKRKLEEKANIGGMDKVKHDTLGIHKLSAQKKLDKIAANQEKLKKKRTNDRLNLFHDTRNEVEAHIATDKKEIGETVERKKKAEKPEEAAFYQKKLDTISYVKGKTAIDYLNTAYNAKDQNIRIIMLQDAFIAQSKIRKLITKTDPKTNQMIVTGEQMAHYEASSLYRDVARFITKFEDLNSPSTEMLQAPEFRKIDQAKIDEMLKYADAMHVMETGAHADGEYAKDDSGNYIQVKAGGLINQFVHVPAPKEDQEAAFNLLLGKINETYESLLRVEQAKPEFFNAPTTESVMENFDLVNDIYKKMQVTSYTIRAMMKSDYVKGGNVPPETMKAFSKKYYFLAAMMSFSSGMTAHITKNSMSMKNTGTFEQPFVDINKSDALPEQYKIQKDSLKKEFGFTDD